MKAQYFKIPKISNECIKVENDDLPHFYDVFHFHPEFQLTLILESEGSAFICDQVINFKAGDIFIIGKNLPHLFKNDREYYQRDFDSRARAISVYFPHDFIELLLQIPESKAVKDLWRLSQYGIFLPNAPEQLKNEFFSLLDHTGVERLINFLIIINKIRLASDYRTISKTLELGTLTGKDSRIEEVFDFIIKGYTSSIPLDLIADKAHMTPTSFSRYFKKITGKTFSRYINELRVSNACNLLGNKGYSVNRACYESGFRNLSNFNRQFKAITGYTPKQYVYHIPGYQ